MNPNIALSIQRPRFDPGEGQRNALAVRNAQMQEAANAMQLQSGMEDMAIRQAQRNALAGVDFSTPEGVRKGATAAAQAGDFDTFKALSEEYRKADEAGRREILDQSEIFTKISPLLMDESTYGIGIAQLAEVAPQYAQMFPPQYDPNKAPLVERMALGTQAWMESQDRDRDFAFRERTTPTVDQRREMAAMRGGGASPYYQFLPTDQGYAVGNARTGDITPASINGQPVVRSTDSPSLQGEIAGSKTAAQEAAQLEAERIKQLPAARANLRKTEAKASELKGMVEKATKLVDKTFASGFGSGVASQVRGSSASNLKSVLTTIKANLGFSELQAMRDASPTGGALGQVAVQELEALQSTIANLDQAQSDDQLKDHLKAIDQHLTNWQNAVNQAYREKFEGMDFGRMPDPEQPAEQPEEQPVTNGVKFLGYE